MVRYVPDRTGRFSQRPHFKPEELDRECENIVAALLREGDGTEEFPLATEQLTRLIERDAEDLDLYADLSEYGPEVEGLTKFVPGRKPLVSISRELASDERRKNRLRTTLAHEWGHVHFHAYLWEIEPPGPDLLRHNPHADKQICKRDTMLDAAEYDWMEWQAGYVCGAVLMPVSRVRSLVRTYQEEHGLFGPIGVTDSHGRALIEAVRRRFDVSADAARIRLLKLGTLGVSSAGPSLFSYQSSAS